MAEPPASRRVWSSSRAVVGPGPRVRIGCQVRIECQEPFGDVRTECQDPLDDRRPAQPALNHAFRRQESLRPDSLSGRSGSPRRNSPSGSPRSSWCRHPGPSTSLAKRHRPMPSRCLVRSAEARGNDVRHPWRKPGRFTGELGGPSSNETLPIALPPLVIGRFIRQPSLRARRAAGGRCRRCRSSPAAYWSGQPGTLLATMQRERRPARGRRQRAAARGGVAAVRIRRSILIRCRGRRAPLGPRRRHRRRQPRPKFRLPDPEWLPQHGRTLQRRSGKGGPPVRERHERDVIGRPRPLAVLQLNGDDRDGERIPSGGVGRSRDVELLPDQETRRRAVQNKGVIPRKRRPGPSPGTPRRRSSCSACSTNPSSRGR